jgi:ATP-dependent 26S proteasome regulatory subunit
VLQSKAQGISRLPTCICAAGVLLYGPPGTGKTLLARAIACNIDANFLKAGSSHIAVLVAAFA